MKKIILLSFLLGLTFAQAQVGFGTASPEAMLHVVKTTGVANAVKIEGLDSATDAVQNLVIDADGVVKKMVIANQSSSMPKFFYMPSVVLPTNSEDTRITADGSYRYENETFSVDLYALFSTQFSTPVTSSTGSTGLTGFVLTPANSYEYFVTYADGTVFTTGEINISVDGVLTYKVNPDVIIRNGSFMNIVLKVKN